MKVNALKQRQLGGLPIFFQIICSLLKIEVDMLGLSSSALVLNSFNTV